MSIPSSTKSSTEQNQMKTSIAFFCVASLLFSTVSTGNAQDTVESPEAQKQKLSPLEFVQKMAESDADAVVEHWLHCPHHPEIGESEFRQECDCRKPLPGMLIEGARRLGVPLEACASVGDSWRDLAAAAAVDIPAVLVTTGKGAAEWRTALNALGTAPPTAPDLGAAVDWLLGLPRS